ncbi:hypothetical protein Tco_0902465 [Tanacetum coccineum]
MGGIFCLEARDMDTKLLSAPESNNTLARCSSLGIVITSSGWPFVSVVLGQMAHLVTSITLNSASIRPEGFLSSVLLWLVIIVAVVGVDVTVVVVVERASLGLVVLSVFAMLAACAPELRGHDCIQKTFLICLVMSLDIFDDLFYISNPEASQSNLAIISHLISLKFSNLSMRLSEERVHLGDLKFPQFAPRDVPDLSYESFLLSQIIFQMLCPFLWCDSFLSALRHPAMTFGSSGYAKDF